MDAGLVCYTFINTYAHSDQNPPTTTSHNPRTDGKEFHDSVEGRVLLMAAPVDEVEDDEGLQEREEEDEGVARGGGQEGGEEGDCLCVFFVGGWMVVGD